MPQDMRWDRHLSVADDGEGLTGHAGAVLLRKLADQCGLTSPESLRPTISKFETAGTL
jgi:hypothetical protein